MGYKVSRMAAIGSRNIRNRMTTQGRLQAVGSPILGFLNCPHINVVVPPKKQETIETSKGKDRQDGVRSFSHIRTVLSIHYLLGPMMRCFSRLIEGYVHNGRIGVMIELGMESDFAARLDEIKSLARGLAMQVAACNPSNLSELLVQDYIKDPSQTVGAILRSESRRLKEEVVVTRFIRWDTEHDWPSPEVPPDDPAVAIRLRKVG